jgi:hypothetical protein
LKGARRRGAEAICVAGSVAAVPGNTVVQWRNFNLKAKLESS